MLVRDEFPRPASGVIATLFYETYSLRRRPQGSLVSGVYSGKTDGAWVDFVYRPGAVMHGMLLYSVGYIA